jgi:type II secretory ATPase GspE/PulE/Tfp pilus assembly ATPase PilB-like protein
MLIGEYLIKIGKIRRSQLEAGLAEQRVTREPIGRILVRNGFLKQLDLVEALRERGPGTLQSEKSFVRSIPWKVLNATRTMVIADMPDIIYVSTLSSPAATERAIRPYIGERVLSFVAASPQRIDDYLIQARSMGRESDNILERLIRDALDTGASDLHIMPREKSYTALVRKHGVRRLEHEGSLDEYQSLVAQVKDRSKMDLAERRKPQDGAFSIEHNGRNVDMRVATLPIVGGEAMVIRVLDPERVNPELDRLGITRVDEFRKAVSRPDGLVLICGPTGSGKTTTLNSTIREMEVMERAIYSVEDPVEYTIPYVGQVATNETVGLDFARAVKAFMRADPDVIIVGEIRDLETARNAIKAAETGHMVLGTLHTSSILGVIGRLRDIGVEAHELRYLLRGALAQRLIRTVCPVCSGEGCEACEQSGYAGRTIVSECTYLPDEKAVQDVIDGKRSWDTMIEDVMVKLDQGITNRYEVERVFGAEATDLIANGVA